MDSRRFFGGEGFQAGLWVEDGRDDARVVFSETPQLDAVELGREFGEHGRALLGQQLRPVEISVPEVVEADRCLQ